MTTRPRRKSIAPAPAPKLSQVMLGLTLGAVVALLPSVAHADVFGLKARNVPQGGPLPTILFAFAEDTSDFDRIGEVRLAGQPIAADGLALSAVHGLLAFQVDTGGSRLISIDGKNATATVIGPLLAGREIRGALFDQADRLLALDLRENELLTVEPTTGLVIKEVLVDVVIEQNGVADLAIDAAGDLIFVQSAAPCVGAQFYTLDPVSGHASAGYCERDTRPSERYPIAFIGLAFARDRGEWRLFGLDAYDWDDDIFSYRMPLSASNRRTDFIGILPEFNSGMGDLASLVTAPPPSSTATHTPTATPTNTATRTGTATRTATLTVIATKTASATASSTRVPGPVYLPIVVTERCEPETRHSDVVLVLDTSTSMKERTRTGRTKQDAARAAAREFIALLRLENGDRAAIAWFNDRALIEQSLTNDRRALHAALDRLTLHEYTRLDLGVAVAYQELVNSRRHPPNVPVMIVLTDGRANPVPASVAIDEARKAKESGVVIYTIGLGDDLDVGALESMASRSSYFYRAPEAEMLADIYRAIAAKVPCQPTNFWGRR